MKPDLKDDRLLLAWVSQIIQREQQDLTHGRVVVHMEGGRITRSVVEKSEKPPRHSDGQMYAVK